MHQGEIVLLQGELKVGNIFSPTHLFRKIIRDSVLGNLTSGILAGNIIHSGYPKPDIINLNSRIERMKRYEVALCTINDVQTYEVLKTKYEFLQSKCGVIIIGGQLPSRATKTFQKSFPHANIFVGECEGNMKKILDLSLRGEKNNLWTSSSPANIFDDYVLPIRYGKKYMWPVELGRGCNNHCPYCSLPTCMRLVRKRNIEQLKDEINNIDKILFVDPNVVGYSHDYLFDVFYFILKHKKKWAGEGIITQVLNLPKDLKDLMFRSCIGFMGGIEDPNLKSLHQNKFDGRLLPKGGGYIPVYSFIVGHPNQTMENFKRIQHMVRKQNLTPVFHIYSPTCGTSDYEKALRNNRLSNQDLESFDRRKVVVKGKVSPEKIKRAFIEARLSINLKGTIEEVIRIFRDSDYFSIAFYRISLLIRIRAMNIIRGRCGKRNKRKK